MTNNDAGLRVRLFSGVSADEATQIVSLLTPRRLAAGEVLFHCGDRGSSAFLVMEGAVNIIGEVDGERHPLAKLGPGAVLGESSLLLHAPRSATAVAGADTVLLEMTREVLRAAIDSGQPWVSKLLLSVGRELAQRLRDANEQTLALIADAGAAGPPSRVAELETLRHRLLSDWSF